MRAHRSTSGFTLPELMTVIVLIGVLTAIGLFSLSGYGRAQNAASLARGIEYAMMRARADALGDGRQRRLSCTRAGCSTLLATWTGMGACPATPCFSDGDDHILAGSHALIFNVDGTTDWKTSTPGTQMSGTQTITFYPDGSATPATVYVSDQDGGNQFKVYVYAGTGMARLVSNW